MVQELARGPRVLAQDRPPSVMEQRSAFRRVEVALERLEGPVGRASGALSAIYRERAMTRAKLIECIPEDEWGPLHGVPFVAKGNMAVANEPNVGMSLYSEWRAPADAAAIELLERLGAVLVGRSTFPELSLSGAETDADPEYPRVENPWDSTRTIGGSSSGSASAVALRLVPFALGTDTGGSVRIPAAFAGVTGIKPTHNFFNRSGILPVSWTLDQVGLLAEDVNLLHTAVAAILETGGCTSIFRGRRVGVVRDVTAAFHRTHPAVEGMLTRAAARLEAADWSIQEVGGADFLACQPAVSAIINFEAARSHGPATQLRSAPFGPVVTRRLKVGAAMEEDFYFEALALQQEFRARLYKVFEVIDVILMATVPFPAPLIAELPTFDAGEHAALTRLANYTGVPAVTVPGAWVPEGVPLGCQLLARPGEDLLAIEAAAVVVGGVLQKEN